MVARLETRRGGSRLISSRKPSIPALSSPTRESRFVKRVGGGRSVEISKIAKEKGRGFQR